MTETYDDRYNNSESATRYIKQRVADVAPTLDSDDDSSKKPVKLKPAIWASVVAGGVAGVVVDFSLYPLDTFKTRLQSKEGFRSSGGFRRVYKGIIPVLLCSAPVSALFFCIYNTVINSLRTENSTLNPFVYIIAASAAELLCSSVRVPLEIIKQRKQTSSNKTLYIIKKTLRKEGILGFYRGFSSTIVREIPFACIQYPLWEYMINQLIIYQNGEQLTALQTAYCGAVAGATAAACTTPVDVVKTRIMLAEKEKVEYYKPNVYYKFAREIYYNRGIFGFFAGVVPRTMWIMLGGFIYFGAYEKIKLLTEQKWCVFKDNVEMVHDIAPSYLEEKLITYWSDNFCPGQKNEGTEGITEEERMEQEQKIIDATLLHPSSNSTSNNNKNSAEVTRKFVKLSEVWKYMGHEYEFTKSTKLQ